MSTSTSEKALRRRELEASRKLAEAASTDPGAGLPRDEARIARDRQIAAAQEARTARDMARAELASREAEKQTCGGSIKIPAGPGRIPPRWPDYDRVASDGIKYREDSVVQLERLGYLTIERGPDTLTISYGDRTRALAKSHSETIGRNAA